MNIAKFPGTKVPKITRNLSTLLADLEVLMRDMTLEVKKVEDRKVEGKKHTTVFFVNRRLMDQKNVFATS